MDRLALAALALCCLLAAPSTGQPALHATVTAQAIPEGLRLNVTSSDGLGAAVVALTHEDPIEGSIVDRLVPITVHAGETAVLDLRDLREGVNFTARVLPTPDVRQFLDPTLRLVNSTLVDRVVDVASTVIPRPSQGQPGLAPSRTVPGYPIAEGHGWLPRVLTTPEGRIVASWQEDVPERNVTFPYTAIRVAVSTDGGHTFGAPVNVTQRIFSNSGWSWAIDADGQVVFVYGEQTRNDGQWPRDQGDYRALGPTWIARYDPVSATLGARTPLAGDLRIMGASDLAPMADGRLLLAALGARHGDDGPVSTQPQLWVLPATGSATFLRELAAPPADGYNSYSPIELDVRGPYQVLVWRVPVGEPGSAKNEAYVSRSSDGGATFETPWSLDPTGTAQLLHPQVRLSIDESGTAHFLATAVEKGANATDPQDWRANSLYVRLPALSRVPIVTRINGQQPGVLVPESVNSMSAFLTLHGKRVWLFLEDVEDLGGGHGQIHTFGLESTDGGATFSRPFRVMTNFQQVPILSLDDSVIMPEGRPALVGLYTFSNTRVLPTFMPFFDPLPPTGSELVRIAYQSLGAAPPPVVPFVNATHEALSTQTGTPSTPTHSQATGTSTTATATTRDTGQGHAAPAPAAALLLVLLGAGFAARRRRA